MPQVFIALAPLIAQTDDGGSSAGSILGFLLPLVILGGLFYVLLYLPRRRQQKKAEELLGEITVGDEVRTIGGIYGKVHAEDDDTYTIDLGDGTKMKVAKRAVAERLGDDDE